MGRIKGRHLKVAATRLAASSGEQGFSQEFKKTNQLLKALGIMPRSKKERNKLAGILSSSKRKQNRREKQEA